MARKKNEVVFTPQPDYPEQVAARINELQNETVAHYDRAVALAGELGYAGAVTVDALEGEIRFYQRRTVEAILETGKRLLVLKELTAHGKFAERVQDLGINYRTARRFMQAATKTAKLANLANLSKEMKSASAFLELVTHDDDADLEKLAELDEIDRLSASQVRERLRDLQAEREATQKLMADKNQKMDTLEARLEQALKPKSLPAPAPDVARQGLCVQAVGRATGIEQEVRVTLHAALAELLAHGAEHGLNPGRHGNTALAAACMMQIQQALNDVRDEFELPKFQNYVPDWYEATRGEAAADTPKTREEALADGDVWLEDYAVDPEAAGLSANNVQ